MKDWRILAQWLIAISSLGFLFVSSMFVSFYVLNRNFNQQWTSEIISWNKKIELKSYKEAEKLLEKMKEMLDHSKFLKFDNFIHFSSNSKLYRKLSLIRLMEYKLNLLRKKNIDFQPIYDHLKGYYSNSEVYKNFNICNELLLAVLIQEFPQEVEKLVNKHGISTMHLPIMLIHYIKHPELSDRYCWLYFLQNTSNSFPNLQTAVSDLAAC